MSGSLNKVMIIGNLGKDPEVRMIPNGDKVVNFSVATTERFKDAAGVKKEKTEWHKIVLWRGLAEIAEKYLRKGSTVYIEGKLTTRKWEKDGVTHYSTDVVGETLQMLGGKQDSQGQQSPQADQGFQPDDNEFAF